MGPTKSMQVSGTVEQQKSKAMVEADAERKKGVSPETMLKKSRDAMHAAVTMMRAAKQSDTNVLKQEISQIVSKDTQKEATKEVEKAKEAMKNLAFDSQAEEKKIIERNEEVEHKKPIEQTNAALNQLTKVLRPETPNNNHVMIKESQVKADIRNREESRTAPTDCERRGHHIAAIDRVDCYLRKALVPDANLVKETQTKLDQSRIDKLVSKVKLEVSKLHSGKVAAIVKDAQEQLQRLRVHSHNVMDRTNIKKALTALDHLRNIEKQQVDAVEINSDRKALEKQSAIAAARAEVFANEAMKIQAQQNSSMMEVQSLEDSDKVMPVMKSNVTHSKEVQNFDDKDVVTEEAVPTAIEEHLTQAQRVNQLERQKETKAEGARQLATNVSIANATQPD